MLPYKYVLFDWNGTLIDDLDMNIEIEQLLLSRRSLASVGSKEFYLENFGFPIIEFYEMLGFDFTKEKYEDVAVEYAREYSERLCKAKLFDDVLPTLQKLKNAGIKTAIISATEQEELLKQVSRFGIESYFEEILGAQNNLGKSKVQTALDWFSSKNISAKSAVFLGDTTHDFETAKAIGCSCFLICRGHNSERRLKETGCEVFASLKKVSERLLTL